MTSDERHRHMDAARVHAELTVQGVWLRYVALGGTGDAFDLDGYLQGLVPLATFQQDILAQALNEALEDGYRSRRIPLSGFTGGEGEDARLEELVQGLLRTGQALAPGQGRPCPDGPEPSAGESGGAVGKGGPAPQL